MTLKKKKREQEQGLDFAWMLTCYLTASSCFWLTDTQWITQHILGTAPLCSRFWNSEMAIKDNLPESLMFSTRTSKKNNKDGKQCAEFIDRKVFKNALILRKCGVYSLCPGHEASTDVFDCDSVHFWSTHLLHHLHCLLRVVTQLTDHVHWRETGKCLRSHSIYYVEHGHIINPDWIRRLS